MPGTRTFGIYYATYGGGSWGLERVYDDPSNYRPRSISMAFSPSGLVHFCAVSEIAQDLVHLERY